MRQILESNTNQDYPNRYDLTGTVGIGWTTNTNEKFYFDIEDFDKIKSFSWYAGYTNRDKITGVPYGWRIVAGVNPDVWGKRTIKLHQLIMDGNGYDHKDRDPYNNTKANLRQATAQENTRNRGLQKNNTSGMTGVRHNKEKNTYEAYITCDYETIKLGAFKSFDDAVQARLEAEATVFKEFSSRRGVFAERGIDEKEYFSRPTCKKENLWG